MLSSISRSPATSAILPVGSVRTGNAQPAADELLGHRCTVLSSVAPTASGPSVH